MRAKQKRALHKRVASRSRLGGELIRQAMKRKMSFSSAARFLANGTASGGNGKTAAGRPISEIALKAAVQRFVDLYDFAPIAYVTFDRSGHVKEINLAAAKLLGLSRKQLIDSSFAVHVFKEDSDLFLNHLLRCRMTEPRVETELRLKNRNRQIVLARLSSSPTTSSMHDGALLYQTAIVDLTERKRAEEAIRESEERHRALVSQTAAGMAQTNLKGQLEFVNGEFCEMLGYRNSELIGKTISEITHRDDVTESRRLFQRLVREGRPYQLEKRYLRKDGSILWANVSASPMRDVNAKTQSAIAVIVDISERKRAQEALEDSKIFLEKRVAERTAELIAANEVLHNEIALRKRLEREIIEISDREQRRLGQDLHDSLCQNLTAIAFMTRAVARRLKDHRVIEVGDIEKIADLINDGVTEARTIARGLHPVEMDSAGLSSALRALLHRQSNLPYRLDMDEEVSISDPTVALHLFRIAREAVMNANKHARARELVLRMRRFPKHIELSVTDNGIGLPRQFIKGPGMGFHIMEYRARSIGARLEVAPVKPHGTRVTCYLPHK
jgi:PAS domain S-box-containing protein